VLVVLERLMMQQQLVQQAEVAAGQRLQISAVRKAVVQPLQVVLVEMLARVL
jgi:hypothetical protein